jgi:hypothetical protein
LQDQPWLVVLVVQPVVVYLVKDLLVDLLPQPVVVAEQVEKVSPVESVAADSIGLTARPMQVVVVELFRVQDLPMVVVVREQDLGQEYQVQPIPVVAEVVAQLAVLVKVVRE